MKKNVGNTDKWIRVILGLAIMSLLIILPGGWRWLGLIGLIPIATALINFCPIYAIFGLSTKKDK